MQIDKAKAELGLINLAKDTYKREGVLGFYRGYTALLLFSMPKNSVRFAGFEFAQKNLLTDKKNKMHTFGCGLFAGCSEAVAVVTPQETLKTKLIHDRLSATPQYKNIFSGIYIIASETGMKGLYMGLAPTVLKQSTNQGVRFVVFADTKNKLG
jgi:solute carrier family 25 (mitochondrial citrate transporter), member 1